MAQLATLLFTHLLYRSVCPSTTFDSALVSFLRVVALDSLFNRGVNNVQVHLRVISPTKEGKERKNDERKRRWRNERRQRTLITLVPKWRSCKVQFGSAANYLPYKRGKKERMKEEEEKPKKTPRVQWQLVPKRCKLRDDHHNIT